MFKFLKEKLKGAVSRFSKEVKEEAEVVEEVAEKPKKEVKEKKKEKAEKPKEKKKEEKPKKVEKKEEKPEEVKEEEKIEEIKEKVEEELEKAEEIEKEAEEEIKKVEEEEKEIEEIKEEEKVEEVPEKKPFFRKLFKKKEVEEKPKEEKKPVFFKKIKETITKKALTEQKFNDLFWDLEVILLENNVAVEVIEKIKEDLKNELVNTKVFRGKIFDVIEETLKKSISELFETEKVDLLGNVQQKKPYVIAFVGVNGSGKTTTIAKMAKLFQNNNMKCVLAAADTFRAAAIQQLEEHANNLGVKIIKYDYGADPAAVAFEAVKYAQSKGLDVVLIDTAGRQHSNINLMEEMEKIMRIAKPDMKIFIGESITGNDCVEQAKSFNEAVGIDAIILSKADVDEKGGAAISISYVTKKPIIYLGTGQSYEDLQEFDKAVILRSLGFED
jgi:fused signal recognition particle receptor